MEQENKECTFQPKINRYKTPKKRTVEDMMKWKEQKELKVKEMMHQDVILLSSKKKRKGFSNVEESKKTVDKLLQSQILKEIHLEELRKS